MNELNIDLKYSFLQDIEPSDMQLEALMKEVAEESMKKKEAADKDLKKLIQREIEIAADKSKIILEGIKQ